MDDDDLEKPKKLTRIGIARLVVAATLALGTGGFFYYKHFILVKQALGGPCKFAMHCQADAPKCLKQSEEGEGVCSRACDPPTDCAEGVRCIKVELEERDDRGMPLEGGYCFPQALLDARKPKKEPRDAGVLRDSVIDVPQAAGQLEGEIALTSGKGEARTYLVKGTLLRAQGGSDKKRTVIDASAMRTYAIDDDKKTYGASAIDAAQGDARVIKTARKDNVAGRECEIWQIDDDKASREACVLQGGAFVDPQARATPPWMRELAVRGAFPLRVVELADGGPRDAPRWIAQRVDVHPVDAALFALPRSYKNIAAR